MSPTLMWTRSKSLHSAALCVPFPLPWTPIITYLRMDSTFARSSGRRAQRAGRDPRAETGRIDAPGVRHTHDIVFGDEHAGLVLQGGRQARGAFGGVRDAVPRGDELADVAERADQVAVAGPLPPVQLGDAVTGEELDLGLQLGRQPDDVDVDIGTQQPAAGHQGPV